ncbi:MAG: helix-turn-helix domain-containing protein [Bacteroidetes bacterium]|nr:helix-turn-helix domain-containing protein [Bacteroidota bacterium]
MSHFAQNLKFLRLEKKLSQDALAQKIGMNRGNIASYEKGTAEPSLKNLLKITQYFNVNLNAFLEGNFENQHEFLHHVSQEDQIRINGDAVSETLWADTFREKMMINKHSLEEFRKRSDEMSMILEGFRQFHKFKMESGKPISDDVRKMAMDYEKLLEVLEDVLKTNKNIIHILEQNE